MSTMHISQLSHLSGIPPTTLRYYESVGLLSAERDSTGFRIYPANAVSRLEFIVAAKHLGLPLIEIRDLLVVCDDHVPPARRDDFRRQVATRLDEADLRVKELTTFMDSLRCALQRLETP